MDEWLHIAHTMEPENVQQAKQGVSIKGLLEMILANKAKKVHLKKKTKGAYTAKKKIRLMNVYLIQISKQSKIS